MTPELEMEQGFAQVQALVDKVYAMSRHPNFMRGAFENPLMIPHPHYAPRPASTWRRRIIAGTAGAVITLASLIGSVVVALALVQTS